MLKAIRKFVGRRDRVVEECGFTPQPSSLDIPMHSGKPQSEASAEELVRGTVKWFNPIKGYGFVALWPKNRKRPFQFTGNITANCAEPGP